LLQFFYSVILQWTASFYCQNSCLCRKSAVLQHHSGWYGFV